MIIGLHGALRSGKDTAYKLIAEEFGSERQVQRRAFADPLKISAARALGVRGTTEQLVEFCNKLKETGQINVVWDEISEVTRNLFPQGTHLTGREYLQWYGTEAHREVFGTNFWVDAGLPPYDGLGNSEYGLFGVDPTEDLLIYTDVRFPNEAQRIHQWPDAEVWKIVREGTGGEAHASENPLPDDLVDRVIENNGSLQDLRLALAHEVDDLLGLVTR